MWIRFSVRFRAQSAIRFSWFPSTDYCMLTTDYEGLNFDLPEESRTMPPNLTSKQKELLDLVAMLGREKFAPRAEKYDREASFPFENYADLENIIC